MYKQIGLSESLYWLFAAGLLYTFNKQEDFRMQNLCILN